MANRQPQSRRRVEDYRRQSGNYYAKKSHTKTWILIFLSGLLIALIAVIFILKEEYSVNIVEPTYTDDIVMTIHGDKNTQLLKGEQYIESGAYAIDKNEGIVNDSIKIEGSVDSNKAGTYTITYTAHNSKDEYAKAERTVNVVDSMDKDTDGISVMMYHYVYADNAPPAELSSNFLLASSFEAQLKWLKDNNYYYYPSYKELGAYIEGKHSLPKKSVVLTFDDGEEGFLSVGGALLKKYEIPATSFIIGDLPQTTDNLKRFANPYIDYQNHTFGLHVKGTSGRGHGGKIFDLNCAQQTEDFKHCQQITGTTEALAYPFGDFSEDSPKACEDAGILCAFTVDYGQVHVGDNPFSLSRMRIFGSGSLEGFIFQVEHGPE